MSTVEATITRREVAGGAIEFEEHPRGSLNGDGEERDRDYRAYHWLAQGPCPSCVEGRAPSEKRPGHTIKCKACAGTGEPKRQRMTSVSTITDNVLPKDGLPPWAEARGVEGLLKAIQLGYIDPLTITGPEAIERVRGLGFGQEAAKLEAADRGKFSAHKPLEDYMRTGSAPRIGDFPVEHAGYVQGLNRLLLTHHPEPLLVEEMVCHPELGYAGRSDVVVLVDGMRVRWDLKSQEKGQVFPGAHLQVRLYEMAAVRSGDEPCDLLQVVVVDARGGFAVVACAYDDDDALSALAWYRRQAGGVNVCSAHNEIARKLARR